MPPKKKQEEIDPATLPPCKRVAVQMAYHGKKTRANLLKGLIHNKPFRFQKVVNRKDIIDHAKEKGIYTDPSTLTDKQKKDPKIMSELALELTPEVLGKAAVSLLNAVELKFRIEMKARAEPKDDKEDHKGSKKEPKEQKPPEPQVPQREFDKNFDLLVFLQNYPKKGQYEAFFKEGGNMLAMVNVQQKVQWLIDMDEQAYEDGKPDQEVNIAGIKENQQLNEEDLQHNKQQAQIISDLKNEKASCEGGPLLNVFLLDSHFEVDPYSISQKNIQQLHETIIEDICYNSLQYNQFQEWISKKKATPFQYSTTKALNSPLLEQLLSKDHSITSIVKNVVNLTQQPFIEQFNRAQKEAKQRKLAAALDSVSIAQSKQMSYIPQYLPQDQLDPEIQTIVNMVLPGVERNLMPARAPRSKGLRLERRSRLVPFVKGSFNDFQHQLSLVYFQNMLHGQNDQRSFDLGKHQYLERIGIDSLQVRLYRALEQQPTLISKYNEKQDRLYLILYHRTPRGRTLRKGWSNQWAVLPSFQNWITHFKNDDKNLQNENFYDLDQRKYGGQVDKLKVFFPLEDNTLLFVREYQLGSSLQHSVWVSRHSLEFGIKQGNMWAQVKGAKLRTQKEKYGWALSLLTSEGNSMLALPGCQLYQKCFRCKIPSRKTILSGHTTIFDTPRRVLHPGGELTIGTPMEVINNRGLGVRLDNSSLVECGTASRNLQGLNFTKREDGTMITRRDEETWIECYDGTVMHQLGDLLEIQKKQFATLTVIPHERIDAKLGEVRVSVVQQPSQELFECELPDKTRISLQAQQVCVRPQGDGPLFTIDLQSETLQFTDQQSNIFKIHGDGSCDNKFANPIIYNQDEERPATPGFQTGESVQDEAASLPLPELSVKPRFFMIEGSGEYAVQFHSSSQIGDPTVSKDSCLDKQKHQKAQFMVVPKNRFSEPARIKVPRISGLDLLGKKKGEEEKGESAVWAIRQQTDMGEFVSRQDFRASLEQYFSWKKEFIKEYNEFGHRSTSPDQKVQHLDLMNKIIAFRSAHQNPLSIQDDYQRSIQLFESKLKEEQRRKEEEEAAKKVVPEPVAKEVPLIKISRSNHPKLQDSVSGVKHDSLAINYFQTMQGKEFLKKNPPSKPSMKKVKPLIEQSQEVSKIQHLKEEHEKHSSPQPSKPPESIRAEIQPVVIKPSVFTRAEIEQEKRELEQEKSSYRMRELRQKEYNIYQQERKNKPVPASVLRTNPQSELNQKYILTEAMTDRKIKISSMKNKVSTKSPSMQEERTEGTHHPMMKTFDKKYNYQQLIQRKSMMIQADINDRLRRDILILPAEADFGRLKIGGVYQMRITVKNQDAISQRINIHPSKHPNIKIVMSSTGPIALGINRQIIIQIKANDNARGKLSESFEIVTKHEVYQIPVRAVIQPQEVYQKQKSEQELVGMQEGGGWVRLVGQASEGVWDNSLVLPRIKQQ